MALVRLAALRVRILRIERCIFQCARGVDIAVLTYVFEQDVVPGAPVQTIGFLPALRRAVGIAGAAARRIIYEAPRIETIVALIRAQHPIPVDEHPDALLK